MRRPPARRPRSRRDHRSRRARETAALPAFGDVIDAVGQIVPDLALEGVDVLESPYRPYSDRDPVAQFGCRRIEPVRTQLVGERLATVAVVDQDRRVRVGLEEVA